MKTGILLGIFLLAGCAHQTAQQPYRAPDSEKYLIHAEMQNLVLKMWINDTMIIDEPFVNQDKRFSAVFNTDFTNVYTRTYKNKKVMARCKRTTHAFSGPDHECDVFIDGDFAANLFIR